MNIFANCYAETTALQPQEKEVERAKKDVDAAKRRAGKRNGDKGETIISRLRGRGRY